MQAVASTMIDSITNILAPVYASREGIDKNLIPSTCLISLKDEKEEG